MMIRSVFILSLVASAAFAQTKPAPKPTPALPVLEASKITAEAEVKRLEKAIAESATNRNLVPCDFYALKMQLEYNQWFLDPKHYDVLAEMNSKIDATIANINAKLSSLENETVSVLVTKGQGAQASEVPVGFKDLIDFFKLYEDRMKNCPKDQTAMMIKMMEEEPLANPMRIVLSQVRSAGGMMSVNINASLKEQDASYEIVMTPKDCGYSVELQVKVDLNGAKETYRFSLLEGGPSSKQVKLGEKAKWEMLSKGEIDGMPIDGMLRYRKFQNEIAGGCTNLASISSSPLGLPYVKYAEVPKIVAALEAKRASKWYSKVTFVKVPSRNFEVQATEVMQSQWFAEMKNNPSLFTKINHCPETWSDGVDPKGMCPFSPVEAVSYHEALEFIKKMNRRGDGYIYRLPTSDEWQYVASGGGAAVPSLNAVAWYRVNSGGYPHEVASAGGAGGHSASAANGYGLYDMLGNVWEWTSDERINGGSFEQIINNVTATSSTSVGADYKS